MCNLSLNCKIFFYLILILCQLARFILSLMITIDTEFRKDVIIISIFGLLCTLMIFFGFIFVAIGISYGDFVYVSTKDYIYEYRIDITKEDYRDTRKRWDNQDYYYNLYMRTSNLSLIFTIVIIEEIFRIDMFNKTYTTKSGFSDKYKSDYYIYFIIETLIEFVWAIIYRCLEYFDKV